MNLIGRYLKCLKDRPQSIRASKDDILKVIKDGVCINITTKDPAPWSFSLISDAYELLSEDYNPEQTTELPEYVECIKSIGYLEVGAIVKCKHEEFQFFWLYEKNIKHQKYTGSNVRKLEKNGIWDTMGYKSVYSSDKIQEHFKASTKEAYHLQNNIDKNNPPFNIGDVVYLDKYYQHTTESKDYSKADNLPLNTPLTIGSIRFDNNVYGDSDKEWVIWFNSYAFGHPAVKFKKYAEMKNENKEYPFKVGDWVVCNIDKRSTMRKGDVTTISFIGIHNGLEKVMTPELDREYPSKSGWGYVDDFRKALPHEIPQCKAESVSFPNEGCVYEHPDEMQKFIEYLVNRPYNKCDTKTARHGSIGIAWNRDSCWFLKTKTSGKKEYNIDYINYILFGYDIKDSDSFTLPEKWCIKSSPDIVDVISKFWDNSLFLNNVYTRTSTIEDYKDYYWYSHNLTSGAAFGRNGGANHTSGYKREGFTEITFEQFKKYVLKKNITKSESNNDKEYQVKNYIKNPCSEIDLKSNNGMVDLYIPVVQELPVIVDYSLNMKLMDIKLPDFSVKPEKIETIQIESYNIYY